MASRQFWVLFGTIMLCPDVSPRFLSSDWPRFAPAKDQSNWSTDMCQVHSHSAEWHESVVP